MKQSKFMPLNNDEYFASLEKKTLQQRLINANEFKNEISVEEMENKIKKYESSHHFQIWHDGSTIANHGHIMFTVNILYDKAAFYTNTEYKTFSDITMDVQSFIELYLLRKCL